MSQPSAKPAPRPALRPPRPTPSWEALAEYVSGEAPVIGIDEVGRGAWAGPVVAGAVILPPRLLIDGLADSKLLSAARRLALDRLIRRQALAIGLGWVAAAEVDAHGLTWAVRQSGLRALAALTLSAPGAPSPPAPETRAPTPPTPAIPPFTLDLTAAGLEPLLDQRHPAIILDGRHNYLAATHSSIAIVKADALVVPVAAASIVAKVARDRFMQRLALKHPGYGFERHVGYGTAVHRAALSQLGPCPQHRRSYAPLQHYSA